MRKIFTAAVAALTLAGAMASATTPAQAQVYGYDDDDDDEVVAAIVGGVVGLALGALGSRYLGNNYSQPYYGGQPYSGGGYYASQPYAAQPYAAQPYYGNDYYPAAQAYAPAYGYAQPRVCTTSQPVYDPYSGRRVVVQRQYAC